jgi:hypothetical protein
MSSGVAAEAVVRDAIQTSPRLMPAADTEIQSMLPKLLLGVALSLVSAGACAATGCDDTLMTRYRHSALIVDSLRPDKGGQARVFAVDGSVFTAGQARWMQGQLRIFERLCAQTDADQARADKVLSGIEELLKSHHSGS